MRKTIIELTTYLFGASLIVLNIILLVAYAAGSPFPLGFTMFMLGWTAIMLLINRIAVWTKPNRRYAKMSERAFTILMILGIFAIYSVFMLFICIY
jgi:hypothetical protein